VAYLVGTLDVADEALEARASRRRRHEPDACLLLHLPHAVAQAVVQSAILVVPGSQKAQHQQALKKNRGANAGTGR